MRTFSRMLTAPLYAVALVALSAPVAVAAPPGGGDLSWDVTVVDADQSFRGLDAVDRDTAWVTRRERDRRGRQGLSLDRWRIDLAGREPARSRPG